ncbi:MAG: bifunctional transaldolase/phosoglucose isomerase [Planctomycetes bacterium]|nr:bifunctional transaldolase/phosoglucose isomerase [Planctomycetota bacterium]
MSSLTSPSTSARLAQLNAAGQSVWLDFIQRSMLQDGSLARMIASDGLRGMTSNPAIFEKAIAGSKDYVKDLAAAGAECARNPKSVFERLAIADIQSACDLMKPVYESTRCQDGYVSFEVSPDLAFDRAGTLDEARRLWKSVNRPNLMIKVPATPPCITAVRDLLADGINVNITLLFSVDSYEAVANAWLTGLEQWAAKGGDVGRVASVASFFISRIDSLIDGKLEAISKAATTPATKARADALLGKVAIANAKLAYQHYLELKDGARWAALAAKGAQPQRLLWASTSTKNPSYRDVVYVEELIGPETVETIPPATYDAFKDHGVVKQTLTGDLDGAKKTLAELAGVGISLKSATDQLLADGVKIFKDAFDKLLGAVAKHGGTPVEPCDAAPNSNSKGSIGNSGSGSSNSSAARVTVRLPAAVEAEFTKLLADWTSGGKVARLWASDAKLWSGGDEASWTGWLTIVDEQRKQLAKFAELAKDVKEAGFTHFCLLGMGGSSLCPEVWAETFGKLPEMPQLVVLDSTDPAQLHALERRINLTRTLFCVSSKSGSTLEPNIFKAWFFERVKQVVGAKEAGRRFIAVTDPGSNMEKVAQADGFRRIYYGVKSVGGRYSALSDFGLVPAAAMGLDVAKLLDRAAAMKQACMAPSIRDNPGVHLGLVLGAAAKLGRDKLTVVTSQGIADFGAWIEQLVAESTGKNGKGLIPVDRECLGGPEKYGNDRVFVSWELPGQVDPRTSESLTQLAAAGHPVVRVSLADRYDLAGEMFVLEIATAVAGAVLGIHPFDQPDVEASKIATKKITSAYEQTGALPTESPFWSGEGVKLYADPRNAAELTKAAGSGATLAKVLRAHFARIQPGDYAGFLAYVDMTATHESLLQKLRHEVRATKRVATVLGFGPRFLHSTGQAYKGGPSSGVFLQFTCDDARDAQVPGAKYTFGVVKAAQARGDFEVLAQRGRRALRIHLGSDVAAGLKTVADSVTEALA